MADGERDRRRADRRGEMAFVVCCAAAFVVIVLCAAYFVVIWLS
jgi:hypothetical protein